MRGNAKREDASVDVILIGFTNNPDAAILARRLRSLGFGIREVTKPGDLPQLLNGSRRAAIAVYSPDRTDNAEHVLACLDRSGRQAPVIVIVDETDFGQYYSLMNRGAQEYFGLSESPDVIARGVAWAAHSLS